MAKVPAKECLQMMLGLASLVEALQCPQAAQRGIEEGRQTGNEHIPGDQLVVSRFRGLRCWIQAV